MLASAREAAPGIGKAAPLITARHRCQPAGSGRGRGSTPGSQREKGDLGSWKGGENLVLDAEGIVPEQLSLLGVRVCTCAGIRVPGLRAGIAAGIFPRNGADLLVEGLGRLRMPQLSAGGPRGGVLEPLNSWGRSWRGLGVPMDVFWMPL